MDEHDPLRVARERFIRALLDNKAELHEVCGRLERMRRHLRYPCRLLHGAGATARPRESSRPHATRG